MARPRHRRRRPHGDPHRAVQSPRCGASPRPAAPVTFVFMFEPADVLDGLNDEQRRPPRTVRAAAGPGRRGHRQDPDAGRAGGLAASSQGRRRSRILLLTFTRRAADEMLARRTPRGCERGADAASLGAAPSTRWPTGSSGRTPRRSGCRRSSRARPGRRHRPDGPAPRTSTAWSAASGGLPRAGTLRDIYSRCVNTARPVPEVIAASSRGASRTPSRAGSACSAPTSRASASTGCSTSTTCCCTGGPRWPTRPRARCCAAGSTTCWSTSTRTSTRIQVDIVRLLRPDGAGLTVRRRRRAGHLRVPRRRRRPTCSRSPRDYPDAAVVRLERNFRSRQPMLRPGQRGPAAGRRAWSWPCAPSADGGPGPSWSAATTRRPRPGRSATACWRRARPGPTCATRRC